MPGQVKQKAAPAGGAWISHVDREGASTAASGSALPGHSVETDQPQGARNPVVRALASFGRLLTRVCTGSRPDARRNLSPHERAVQDTRKHVTSFLHHLAPPAQSPRSAANARVAETRSAGRLADDLHSLAADHAALASSYEAETGEPLRDCEAHADEVLLNTLDGMLRTDWSGESALKLAQALRDQRVVVAQKIVRGHGDPNAERLLIVMERHVSSAIMKRAEATMDRGLRRTFEKIRENALPTEIQAEAEEAFGVAQAVIAQLRAPKILQPVGSIDTDGEDRTKLAEQTAQVLQVRLGAMEANSAELDTLLRLLPPQALSLLVAGNPAHEAVSAAVHREISARIPRLMQELEREVGIGSVGGRQRANTVITSALNSDVQHLTSLYREILEHSQIFGKDLLDEDRFRALSSALDEHMSTIASSHIRPTGRGNELAKATRTAAKLVDPSVLERLKSHLDTQIERKKATAQARIRSVLDTLASREGTGRTAAYLTACKDMVNAVQDYLFTTGLSPEEMAEPDRLNKELLDLIASMPAESRAVTSTVAQAVRTPEMMRLAQVLADAARMAQQRNLPELHADLRDICTALEIIAATVSPAAQGGASRGRKISSLMQGPAALEEPTRRVLEQHFSTVIEPDGKVALTAGHCSPRFTAKVKELAERPFSSDEIEKITLSDGLRIPQQFWLDAQRTITFLDPDGEPLIDRRDWDRLTVPQQEARVAEGYRKLLRLYEGNEQQTDAILLLANQGMAAAICNAARYESEASPLRLPGYGPGVTNAVQMNCEENTVVRFSKGENHRPQMELSYEIRGGRYDLVDKDGMGTGKTVYLDRNRSRAQFTIKVEADAAHGKLSVLGTPTYDVHLVRSPIQKGFALPKPGHFLLPDAGPLYDAAIDYVERTDTDEGRANALYAMRALVGWKNDPQWRRVQRFYNEHLRPEASRPLPFDTENVRRARESIEGIQAQLGSIFDRAQAAAAERLTRNPPVPSHEARALAQFLARIDEFKSNPAHTVEDAESILASFPLSPEAVPEADDESAPAATASAAPASSAAAPLPDTVHLPADVVMSTYAAINSVKQTINGEMRPALLQLLDGELSAVASDLLPAFTKDLQHAAQDSSPVDL